MSKSYKAIIKEINDFFTDDEWEPELNDKYWEKMKDYNMKKYIGKKKKIQYKTTKKMIDDIEKITKKEDDNNFKHKSVRSPENIIKLYKITDGKLTLFFYTPNSIICSLKKAISYLFRDGKSSLDVFSDITKLNASLVDCFQGEHYAKYMNVIKQSYINANANTIGNIFEMYENVINSYVSKHDPLYLFNIYLFDDKIKKYIFYSDDDVDGDNINEYFENIDDDVDLTNYTLKKLEEYECNYELQAMLHVDKILYEKKMIPNSYNKRYFLINTKVTTSDLTDVRNMIFYQIQREKFENTFDDNTNYSNIQRYVYEISIDDKKFVDVSDGTVTLKDNIMQIYNINSSDKNNYKYLKLIQTLKKTKCEDINVKIIKKKTRAMKVNLDEWMNDYIEKNKTSENGLNVSKETKIVPKYVFMKYLKR